MPLPMLAEEDLTPGAWVRVLVREEGRDLILECRLLRRLGAARCVLLAPPAGGGSDPVRIEVPVATLRRLGWTLDSPTLWRNRQRDVIDLTHVARDDQYNIQAAWDEYLMYTTLQ